MSEELQVVYDEYQAMSLWLTSPVSSKHSTKYVGSLTSSLTRELIEGHTKVKNFLRKEGRYLTLSFYSYVNLCIYPHRFLFDDLRDVREIAKILEV